MRWEDDERALDGACAELERGAKGEARVRLVRLSAERDEIRAWMDHDLASLVENRLGVDVDPPIADAGARRRWIESATEERREHGPGSQYARPMWIEVDGERVGTASLHTPLGGPWLGLSSLYVRRDRRRRGIAGAALDAMVAAARSRALTGIRLETSWCWGETLAFYARRGLWARGWKRELSLIDCTAMPRYCVEVAGDAARFSFVLPGRPPRLAIVAERAGARLRWTETDAMRAKDEAYDEAPWLAPGTFALQLAVRGWPLITSDDAWAAQQKQGFSDFGGPEGLAFKIELYEAWAAHRGWRSTAPRIPGLEYPTWAELERRWDATEE